VSYAQSNHLPVHMHVASSRRRWKPAWPSMGLRPVELLHQHGILNSRFTGIHGDSHHAGKRRVTWQGESAGVRVSHLRAKPGRRRCSGRIDCSRRGAGICFGSDSNVQIDLLEDARLLEYHLRMNKLERVVLAPGSSKDALARRLFASATETGAESLAGSVGSLEVGRGADFFTVDLDDPSLQEPAMHC